MKPQTTEKTVIPLISKKGIEWQITRLKKDGLLKRVGPTKGGHWEIV